MKKFNFWLILFLTQTTFVLLSLKFSLFELLLNSDSTYISLFCVFLFFCVSISTGYKEYLKRKTTEMDWFLADSFLTLGMIGTIIGLIIAFSSFPQLDFNNLAVVKTIISNIATGIATALYTTLVGLVLSFFYKLQLALVEGDYDEKPQVL